MTTKEKQMTKQVEISKLVAPKFLTLTGKPANQVAFKVVRDDSNGASTMSQPNPADAATRLRRTRATQRSSLLYISFPAGTTEEDIALAATEYGLQGYETEAQEDGTTLLKRSDVTDIADAITIKIGDGKTAGIARSEATTAPTKDPMPHISVAAIEFSKDTFQNNDAALAYLQRYDIDFLEKGIENTPTAIRVSRSAPVAEQETRRIEVEKGVVVVVARSDTQDLGAVAATSSFTEVISETCYGQWGWGQLDFAAAMADVEFCDCAREAVRRFENVVEQVMFYSDLPISIRKELVNRASAQFAGYVSTLMDALPAKIVLINRSILDTRKEKDMTQATKDNGTVAQPDTKRADETPIVAKVTEAAPVVDAPAVDTPVTRAELTAAVSEAVASALAAHVAQRSEPVETTPPVDEGEKKLLGTVEEVITRSVSGLADAVKGLGDRLTQMESTTTVRSDNVDSGTSAPKDPFTGIFGKSFK